ncbi:MAG: Ltp family lipoprotein [Emergencia sp.]|nr:Ltp family lipoprotein [Emergencia sp.]
MSKEKMMKCSHCGADIAAAAKVCPVCGGKNKRPVYKRPWFIVLIIVLLIGIGGMAGSDDSTDSTQNNSNQAVEEKVSEEPIQEEEEKKPEVSKEFQNALAKAESYSEIMHMSKQAIYDQLVSEYGEQFSEDAAEYAMEHLKADWKANALAKAKEYQDTMSMSKDAIYDQLISEYGEKFTEKQAQYAIDHLDD